MNNPKHHNRRKSPSNRRRMPRRFSPRIERLEDRLVFAHFLDAAGAQKIAEDVGGFEGGLAGQDRFGRSVATLGDLDQDGVIDMVVGARSDDDGATDAGAVYILFMNPDGTVKSNQKISATSGGLQSGLLDAGDFFGYSVAMIEDINNDGIQDLAVGAPQDDDQGTNAGAAYVLFLNRDGTINGHQKLSVGIGLSAGDSFGQSIGALGDYNNDGTADLVVGAPGTDDGGNGKGAVHLLFLQSNSELGSTVRISETSGGFGGTLDTNDQFGGRQVTNIGDLNGDGQDEIAVGAFRDDDGGQDRGAMYILFLDQTFNVTSEQKISDTVGGFLGTLDDDDLFGMTIAPLGDVDGDGVPDIIVGSSNDDDGATDRGAVFALLLNSDGTVKDELKVSSSVGGFTDLTLEDEGRFGRSLALLGDLRGDGSIAVAAGAGAGNSNGGAVWIIFFDRTTDFGDAPSVYPVTLAQDGARHLGTGPRLGAKLDSEADGLPTADADGDDLDGDDDEDGVMFGTVAVGTQLGAVNIDLQNAAAAKVDAWIDFDSSGSWDADEQILSGADVVSGLQTLNFGIPLKAVQGEFFARIRVSSAGGLSPTGLALDGEVEDHKINIVHGAPTVESIVVNQGDAQRSSINDVRVTFDRVVDVASDAFVFTRMGSAELIDKILEVDDSSGKTIVNLSFQPGPSVNDGGGLIDGEYQLRIDFTKVTYQSIELDGDGNGTGGDDYLFAAFDGFYRKYGDQDGNEIVNLADFSAFRQAFGTLSTDSEYVAGMDFEADGMIGLSDFAKFRQNFGT